MFEKDTFRLIKNTLKRFLSLLLIVLIGVAFMMGLMSDPLIMRNSVDAYNDTNKLHDLQLYSSYGFCQEDIRELKKQEVVKDVFASRFIDTYVTFKDVEYVARFEEAERQVDCFELVEGRMPESGNEAVLLNNASISRHALIGDSIRVTGDANLSRKIYKVVGVVKSPAYTSKILGASNCDNQDLNMIFFIPEENFTADYYTTVYLTLDDCEKEVSYTKEYKDAVKEKEEEIEYFAGEQEGYYRDKLVSRYEKELSDNEALFEEKKAEGEKELAEAKKKLDDAQMEILIGKSQLETQR
ncbi:MAG: ABC transporter permease, partial [Erysipelotrichaceae bacterium]|nr:ABC transporter permease [Erysipelotrichaceae bacterium]